MADYHIPSHVHFAVEGDVVVFMDLRSDQYSMLLGAKARAFNALLSRRSDTLPRSISVDHASPGIDSICHALVDDLVTNGVLKPGANNPAAADLPIIALPDESLLESHITYTTHVRVRDVWTFLISCVLAILRLYFLSIRRTVSIIERRKRLAGSGTDFNLVEAQRLVSVYNRLRPLIPKDYLCLFDSLSLLEFLARNHCYPSWVFAVKFEPWTAHCWVQQGNIALNENVDEARTYLPLMSV